MVDLLVKVWPVLVAAAAVVAWGLQMTYRIAASVTRIEGDLKHQVTQVSDHEIRLRALEDSRARHSVTLEALQ